MEQPITFLTYGDVVEAGACHSGVVSACKEKDCWSGGVDELLKVFDESQHSYILRAAGRNGYGYGYGGV